MFLVTKFLENITNTKPSRTAVSKSRDFFWGGGGSFCFVLESSAVREGGRNFGHSLFSQHPSRRVKENENGHVVVGPPRTNQRL